eukprot:8931133-Alexandrium_andersonii.AAC.1
MTLAAAASWPAVPASGVGSIWKSCSASPSPDPVAPAACAAAPSPELGTLGLAFAARKSAIPRAPPGTGFVGTAISASEICPRLGAAPNVGP